MELGVADFDAFFAAVHEGHQPFAWQRRLVAYLLEERRWPDQIAAPTSAGKTAVIEAHIFAVAATAAELRAERRLPRRLALLVDRRALVDDQYAHTQVVAAKLREARPGTGIVAAVAEALRGLRLGSMSAGEDGAIGDRPSRANRPPLEPLVVAQLRGGIAVSNIWRDDPLACLIVCATPDMWGSRLLFRGYGTAPAARAREAGLLAYDAVAVVDEAHLARQLLCTARRIAALDATAVRPLPVAPLSVVEVTATPDAGAGVGTPGGARRVVGVEPADLSGDKEADRDLARRLTRPKPLRLVEAAWPAKNAAERRKLAGQLAGLTLQMREQHGPTVACIVNTVALALDVADLLAERKAAGRAISHEVLVGRRRPADLARLRHERPALFTPQGDPTLDVVVATQTVEVGVDMNFSALVSEVAPATAITQRAGRVNRLGRSASGEVVVVVPPEGHASFDERDVLPYRAADLEASEAWLRRRAADPQGLAPWAVRHDAPPAQATPRGLLQRPELWDAWLWARTADELVVEPDLDLWLADDLAEDRDVAVVVREGLPADEASALALLRATPPRAKEAFPAALPLVRILLEAARATSEGTPISYLVRNEEVRRLDVDEAASLRPGDVLVIDARLRWFRSGVVADDGTDAASDVLEPAAGDWSDPFVLRIAPGAPAFTSVTPEEVRVWLSAAGAVVDATSRDGRDRRQALADLVRAVATSAPGVPIERLKDAATLLDGPVGRADVTLGPRGADGAPDWLVIAAIPRRAIPEALRQEWSSARRAVALDEHAAAVAERARDFGIGVGLDADLLAALASAGAWHDAGKRDARFQARLRDGHAEADAAVPLLAKSGLRSAPEARAAWSRSGLPSGWRHEQLSAADAWRDRELARLAERELAVRLVGTSHGYGRSGFPHVGSELVPADDPALGAAVALYDNDAWEALIERTHARLGVWGCAYLEALLRAADCQVSGEGR